MNVNYPIIDADGHVLEKDRELHDYLGGRYSSAPRFETYSYFPSLDGWNRGTGVPGKDPETPAPRWLQFLDELGVHMTVLYPTGGLGLGLVQNPEWACVLARAYNSWIADRFYETKSAPAKAVALLPVHEPLEAAKELRASEVAGAGRRSVAGGHLVAQGLRSHRLRSDLRSGRAPRHAAHRPRRTEPRHGLRFFQ